MFTGQTFSVFSWPVAGRAVVRFTWPLPGLLWADSGGRETASVAERLATFEVESGAGGAETAPPEKLSLPSIFLPTSLPDEGK